jgi:hypothetical protein
VYPKHQRETSVSSRIDHYIIVGETKERLGTGLARDTLDCRLVSVEAQSMPVTANDAKGDSCDQTETLTNEGDFGLFACGLWVNKRLIG